MHRRSQPLPGCVRSRVAPQGQAGFAIVESQCQSAAEPFFAVDVAVCERCIEELFEPSDRRFRYPFLNCTDCGPRLTIALGAPYDRERTTMRGFPLCELCRAEYSNPTARRFHAEPTACAQCGPALALLDPSGDECLTRDPIGAAAEALHSEKIVAIKGIGGFHLACLASSERANGRAASAQGVVTKSHSRSWSATRPMRRPCVSSKRPELALLESAARPIVLARRRPSAQVAGAVAGQSPYLGLMLAYTPVHHLLCHALGGAPLVMTSGNASHEPIAFEEEDARRRLRPLSDRILTHNRPIELRLDDSVVRWSNGAASTLRRARGLCPRPTPLGAELKRPLLALGAHDNATFALGRGDHAPRQPPPRGFVERIGERRLRRRHRPL